MWNGTASETSCCMPRRFVGANDPAGLPSLGSGGSGPDARGPLRPFEEWCTTVRRLEDQRRLGGPGRVRPGHYGEQSGSFL